MLHANDDSLGIDGREAESDERKRSKRRDPRSRLTRVFSLSLLLLPCIANASTSDPTKDEVAQFRVDPIAARIEENYALFDLRRLHMSGPLFRPAKEWTAEHLVMVRCLTAKDVTVERIIPSAFLPLSDDPSEPAEAGDLRAACNFANFCFLCPSAELVSAFTEVDLAFGDSSAASTFRGLPKAISELSSASSLLHGGETILHILCAGVPPDYACSRLRKDLSIQHM